MPVPVAGKCGILDIVSSNSLAPAAYLPYLDSSTVGLLGGAFSTFGSAFKSASSIMPSISLILFSLSLILTSRSILSFCFMSFRYFECASSVKPALLNLGAAT